MTQTQKLKGLTIAKGMTQKQLAKSLGIDKSTLSRKVNNQASFTIEEVKKIAEILELSGPELNEIFFG